MRTVTDDIELSTTSGVIALLNLQAQIAGLATQAARRVTTAQQADLVDLWLLHGQVLGRIVDYERAAALAEELVQNAPTDNMAFLARARTHATFHRFSQALADLDTAERLGAELTVLNRERAAIFQALGRYDEALALRRNAVERCPAFAPLGALAGLYAERGEIAEAERLFSASRQCYQDVSPFPVALLDFQRGLMWLEHGDLPAARTWFELALCRLPAYVPAQGHLAEIDAALGEHEAAITRLHPLATCSDDPEYATLLADCLYKTGQLQEARQWRREAATRYNELLLHHPAAFADHAAEFWLTTSGDAKKALHLAQQNLATRQTPRAQALLERAQLAYASH